MQLLASHIGPDRVSDIAANVLKQFLIEYTQRQAEIWQIPLRAGVPIEHVYDHGSCEWIDTNWSMSRRSERTKSSNCACVIGGSLS
jgi:hypothetical protein